jgi:hypothetical protein
LPQAVPVQESGHQQPVARTEKEANPWSVLDVPSTATTARNPLQWESFVRLTPNMSEPLPSGPPVPAEPSAAATSPSPEAVGTTASSSAPDDRLLARARSLLDASDISGARLLLERLADTGHPQGIFMLAESFDPHVLLERGARGIRGDRQKAAELYARALKLGIDDSARRLKALQ